MFKLRKIGIILAGMLLYVGSIAAGTYDLLWDYSTAPPTANPDRGLSYSSTVNDDEGVKNGLKGVKLNSSGWCSFVKAPVAGQLRLTFGPADADDPPQRAGEPHLYHPREAPGDGPGADRVRRGFVR